MAALVATAGTAAAQPQCREIGVVGTVPVPIVDLGSGALAAVSVCIASPDNGALDILVDGNVRMRRSVKGNCGTVAGNRVSLRLVAGGVVMANYCLEAISLRP